MNDDSYGEVSGDRPEADFYSGEVRFNNPTADIIQGYIDRIERLELEKSNLSGDIREVFAEAKGNGFDVPTLKKILKLRSLDSNVRDEQDHLELLYRTAVGMRPVFDKE